MLDVYAFATPNSIKVPIALEELGLDYRLHGINVRKGEQKTPDFVLLNPNAKVPVLVDPGADGGRFVLTEYRRSWSISLRRPASFTHRRRRPGASFRATIFSRVRTWTGVWPVGLLPARRFRAATGRD